MESFEEEDEFDWEAAVREIDLACQKNTSSASSSVPPLSAFLPSSSHFAPTIDAFVRKSNLGGPVFGNGGKHVATKQSTLDKFIGSTSSIPPPESRIVPNPSTYESVDGDDKNPCVGIDPEAVKTWIYPVNVPLREYQFSITKTALFSNTLVALPTGLGKTLIAAVVMYNYFRWFPEGKIVFAAPSRPLVVQQIEACHNIVGIPQEWTIDMTGQTSPSKRAFLWKSKRVFFVTPQVLEKDIQSGACLVNYLVCLIIDEAHRALGNYSYCVVVRELTAVPVKLRILALSATPGSKTQAIQGIIDNLQISTLEYRNEADDDVSPYVHNRKVELIEVPLGRDADDINKCLLDVIRPYAARLSSFGLIQNRDYQTLSPCDLLTARDKFRRAPPSDLPHVNHGNVEACFAALITLYHIRKLLLSHGIRPAYEMLEEKLQQGSFARLMSKNEDIRKAKLLMQCSLSQGAPSPKLSKMLEVLDDHFKMKDPKTSRVIVFSNFRGSVRDIMDALYKIGDVVKATEFIGQSSGKTLKGQSQKVQQAVLEKFRAGGFNVIVATSIGEEGLDIMEVDLVICFDANVSPLRMIQRMGRTGRKHDGRVVVLACEGSELKAYTRKQANGRSIKKHMRNGGMNSFSFHPSPRMIPHVFKPEVQFVELSVKQFVPRGKKLKEDVNPAIETPAFQKKLTPAETDLLAKYFDRDGGNKWRPSLIAFPHFQTSPSKVHNVVHSHRTGMFIDAMQCLQDATFSETNKSFFTELQDKAPSSKKEGFDAAPQIGDDTKDLLFFDDLQVNASQTNAKGPATSPTSTLVTAEKEYEESLPTHQYLFASECASVDALGKVFVMPAPGSLSATAPHSKCTALTKTGDSCLSAPHIDLIMEASQARHLQDSISCGFKQIDDGNIMILSDDDNCEDDELGLRLTNLIKSGVVPDSPDYNQGTKENNRENEKEADPPKLSSPVMFNIESGVVPDSPIYDEWTTKENNREEEEEADAPKLSSPSGFNIEGNFVPDSPVYDQGTTKEDNREEDEEADPSKLSSPAGFNIESSVVPDSPIDDQENNRGKEEEVYPPKHSSPVRFNSDLTQEPSGPKRKNEEGIGGDPQDTSTSNELKTPQKRKDLERERKCVIVSPVPGGWRTPLADLANSSASKDWRLSSGENSEKFEQPRKLKRLRKLGECAANMKENCSGIVNVNRAKSPPRTGFLGKKHFGGKKNCLDNDIRVFIDEEAEVSSEAEMSADEKDDAADNSYEESFIDDRSNLTSSTQADSGKVDMMAIYRRSLLSQSPLPRRLLGVTASSPSPVSVGSLRTINENQSSSDRSLKTMSGSSGTNHNTITTGDITREHDSITRETRKRKFGLYKSVNAPVINLDSKFASLEHSETVGDNEGALDKGNNEDENDDNDDAFYETLDFEAVEAQAAMLLKERSDVGLGAMDERDAEATGKDLRCDGVEKDKPCFDLGFW